MIGKRQPVTGALAGAAFSLLAASALRALQLPARPRQAPEAVRKFGMARHNKPVSGTSGALAGRFLIHD